MSILGAQTADDYLFDDEAHEYDALLLLSFGGPEAMDQVVPFLQNVARGRPVPRQRLETVAQHYYSFGGVSPLNGQMRALMAALQKELETHQVHLPIYWGNRNWQPTIADAVQQMHQDGVRRVVVFVASVFSSYSGCRQYREDVIRANQMFGDDGLQFDKLRGFYNHPGFIEPMVASVKRSLAAVPPDASPELVFTTHSLPVSMARRCDYVAQVQETCRLVAQGVGRDDYEIVYQSRSGPPQVPWLEPDVNTYLHTLAARGVTHVVIVPVGFISDNMEVVYDLDVEACQVGRSLGIDVLRADTVGTDPRFVAMIRELVVERSTAHPVRRFLGERGPLHDVCPLDCCLEK